MVTLAVLIGSQFFFIQVAGNRVLIAITLTIAVGAGAALVHFVKREVAQREQIQELAKRQEDLLHLISHDVKGALALNHNLLYEVLEGEYGPVSTELQGLIRGVDTSTTRTIDMTTTVLRAADAKTGRLRYEMKPFDFAAAVLEVVAFVKPDIEAKGLSFETVIPPNVDWTLVGDRAQIVEHVLRNLVTNAVLYTPAGDITVRLGKINQNITLSVQDTGIGISAEDHAHLFTEGGKGKDSIKVNVHSTGYGLYLAKAVVDAHNGHIWAESEGPGKGSIFYVQLPVDATLS